MATQTLVDETAIVHSKLKLSNSILEEYEDQARASGRTLDEYLSIKLAEMVHHTSVRSLYVNDKARKELETLLRRNISNPEALVKAVASLSRVKVGTVSVNLEEPVNTRLRSRCPRNEKFEHYLHALVTAMLEREAGLR